jgi:hypothetical protein
MREPLGNGRATEPASQDAAIDHMRSALGEDSDWAKALVESMALWTAPSETYRGRSYNYFIAGEAFDWLTLAERLCDEVADLLPRPEIEDLLFTGRLPASFDRAKMRNILGVDKYRGYLNFYYGVTVEEALHLAAELEVLKRYASNGVQYKDDCSEEAFRKIYGSFKSDLLAAFRQEHPAPEANSTDLRESKEFTYWLFKYRLTRSDKARIASDTRKGLQQLESMRAAARARASDSLIERPLPKGVPGPSA